LIQQARGCTVAVKEDLQFAANLAVLYSDARSEARFDVTTAQPKHLLKPQRAGPGAVKLRQEECVLTGYPQDVIELLVAAAGDDESTSSSSSLLVDGAEYRFQDKAKHRKRTKEATAEAKQKKKQQQQAKKAANKR
jgi:hypothetical protein